MRTIKSDYFSDQVIQKFDCKFCSTKFTRLSSVRRHLTQRCKFQLIPTSEIDKFMEQNYEKRAQDNFEIFKN